MAATTSGAIKALIESRGLGLQAFRDDRVPADVELPYVTVTDAMTVDREPNGPARPARGAADRQAVRETVQVSLWQRIRPDAAKPGESYLLADALASALEQAGRAPAGPTAVFGLTVGQVVRVPEPDVNRVQHVITLTVRRERVPR